MLRNSHRIHGDVRKILDGEGVDSSDLPEAFKALRERTDYLQEESDTGRERLLKMYEQIIEDASMKMDKLFDLKPDIGVKVERVPPFKENGSPLAYYFPPPLDRSKGTFLDTITRF